MTCRYTLGPGEVGKSDRECIDAETESWLKVPLDGLPARPSDVEPRRHQNDADRVSDRGRNACKDPMDGMSPAMSHGGDVRKEPYTGTPEHTSLP